MLTEEQTLSPDEIKRHVLASVILYRSELNPLRLQNELSDLRADETGRLNLPKGQSLDDLLKPRYLLRFTLQRSIECVLSQPLVEEWMGSRGDRRQLMYDALYSIKLIFESPRQDWEEPEADNTGYGWFDPRTLEGEKMLADYLAELAGKDNEKGMVWVSPEAHSELRFCVDWLGSLLDLLMLDKEKHRDDQKMQSLRAFLSLSPPYHKVPLYESVLLPLLTSDGARQPVRRMYDRDGLPLEISAYKEWRDHILKIRGVSQRLFDLLDDKNHRFGEPILAEFAEHFRLLELSPSWSAIEEAMNRLLRAPRNQSLDATNTDAAQELTRYRAMLDRAAPALCLSLVCALAIGAVGGEKDRVVMARNGLALLKEGLRFAERDATEIRGAIEAIHAQLGELLRLPGFWGWRNWLTKPDDMLSALNELQKQIPATRTFSREDFKEFVPAAWKGTFERLELWLTLGAPLDANAAELLAMSINDPDLLTPGSCKLPLDFRRMNLQRWGEVLEFVQEDNRKRDPHAIKLAMHALSACGLRGELPLLQAIANVLFSSDSLALESLENSFLWSGRSNLLCIVLRNPSLKSFEQFQAESNGTLIVMPYRSPNLPLPLLQLLRVVREFDVPSAVLIEHSAESQQLQDSLSREDKRVSEIFGPSYDIPLFHYFQNSPRTTLDAQKVIVGARNTQELLDEVRKRLGKP